MPLVCGLYRRLLPRVIAVVLALVLAVIGVLLPAQGAHANSWPQPEFTFSISGWGGAAYLHAGNGTANASAGVDQEWNAGTGGDYETIAMGITGPGGLFYNLMFATPNGSNRHFARGYYPWAQDAGGQLSRGRPGISVWGGRYPCGGSSGSFEIRDIGRVNGQITRLDLVFTRYCGDYAFGRVDIGELKFGYPRTAYEVSQGEVAWPWTTVYPGQSAEAHPVDLRLTSSKTVTVSQPSVTGPGAGDFPIRQQNCTGRLTATGCTVWVGFTPKARGPRHAELIVPTSAGSASVSLDGLGAVGTSNWTVDTNWDGTWQNEHIVIPSVSAGDPYNVISQGFQPIPGTPNATLWTAMFADTQGLKPGTTYTYQNVVPLPPFSMSISQGDGACELKSGSVTVNDLAAVGPDHLLSRLDAVLKASCQSSVPYWVNVRMRFHEAADLTPPGPVTGLKAVRSGGRVTLTWTKPPAADLSGVIIRWYSSANAPGAWFTGNTAYQGTGTTASFSAPATQPVSVSAWAYDITGNVSRASSVHLR
jgi:hypothetical protein